MESDAFLDFLLTADPFNLGLPLSLGLQDEGGPCEGERSQQGVSEGSQVGHSIVFDLSRECDLVSSLDVNELDIVKDIIQ
ncbi:hypothetical protein E2C01_095072 [Portunus trituberculatus]|uniref:Uncharacterized protein n=1 Tax=Portunus trituberculatus TaxID=210409 RepID=A0A5B7JYK2_PORTR|nr:hypothetical protein [Portunus trituberculatus]